MSDSLDFFAGARTITNDSPETALSAIVTGVVFVESGIWLEASVTLVVGVDTSAVLVEIERSDPLVRVVASALLLLNAPVVDPYPATIVFGGLDGPGIVGDVSYNVNVTCQEATDESTIAASTLRARFNALIPPPSVA